MKKLLIAAFLFFGCAPLKVDVEKMKELKTQVAQCMGIELEKAPDLPKVKILYDMESPDPDKVSCSGKVRSACFLPPDTFLFPRSRNTTTNLIKHEWVHYFLYHVYGVAPEDHSSPYFLKCAGVSVE